jgi:FkbM family methyltransferase
MNFATFQQDPSSYLIHETCQIVNLGALYEKVFGIGKRNGRFVEVGAFDGMIYSNVWGLAMMGWKGIAIEPMPENLEKLSLMYARFPNIIVEPLACSEPGVMSLTMFSEREGSRLKEENNPRDLPVLSIPAEPLDMILNRHQWQPDFELLVIDVEGHEESVLKGFAIETWKPKLVIIEMCWQRERLYEIFKEHYGILSEDGLNTLFVRK